MTVTTSITSISRTDNTEPPSIVHARKTVAFEELFLPHLDGAYNLARWIVERDLDAQAVVQEAYIQAVNVFVESRGADARAWLLTIVLNAAHKLDPEAWQSFKRHPVGGTDSPCTDRRAAARVIPRRTEPTTPSRIEQIASRIPGSFGAP